MPDEYVTIGINADVSRFKKAIDDMKKSVKGVGSKVKGQAKESSEVSKETEQSQKKVGSLIAQNVLSQMSFAKSFNGLGKSVDGIKASFKEAGATGKIAMAGVGLAVAGAVAGAVIMIVQAVWDGIKKLVSVADPIGFEKVMSGVNASVNKLKSALGNALMPLFLEMSVAIKYIADGLTMVVEGLVYIRSLLYGLLGINLAEEMQKVADSMEDASESANEGLASFDKLNTVGDLNVSGLKESERIAQLTQDAYETGQMAQLSLGKWVGDLGAKIGNVWSNITNGANNMWNSIKSTASSVWNSIKDGAVTLWNTVGEFAGNVWNGIQNVATSLWIGLVDVASGFWNSVQGFGQGIWSGISETALGIWGGIEDVATSMWNTIKGVAQGVWQSITSFATGVWTAYQTVAQGVINVISGLLKGDWNGVKDTIINVFKGVITTLTGMFDGMWNGITSAFKSIFNGVIGLFNKVIRAYNNTLGSFNVDVLGYNIGLPKIGEIPMLAQGGVADPNSPFLAILGDNKREKEVISPVSTIEQAVRNVLSEGYGADRPVQITVNLDGRTVARQIYDPLKNEARRRGVAPIF